eukprot:scaffold55115_cov63-Phaeocystis_antarctica.AAC.4
MHHAIVAVSARRERDRQLGTSDGAAVTERVASRDRGTRAFHTRGGVHARAAGKAPRRVRRPGHEVEGVRRAVHMLAAEQQLQAVAAQCDRPRRRSGYEAHHAVGGLVWVDLEAHHVAARAAAGEQQHRVPPRASLRARRRHHGTAGGKGRRGARGTTAGRG